MTQITGESIPQQNAQVVQNPQPAQSLSADKQTIEIQNRVIQELKLQYDSMKAQTELLTRQISDLEKLIQSKPVQEPVQAQQPAREQPKSNPEDEGYLQMLRDLGVEINKK